MTPQGARHASTSSGGELAAAKEGRVGEAASSIGGDVLCFRVWLELVEE